MNMSSYQPEQMGTALLGLEILNSWAQDTSSQLKFPHLPWKEMEAGTAPGREPGQPRHSRMGEWPAPKQLRYRMAEGPGTGHKACTPGPPGPPTHRRHFL